MRLQLCSGCTSDAISEAEEVAVGITTVMLPLLPMHMLYDV